MIMQDSDTYLVSKDGGATTAQESTDAEIREGTASVMISSDRDIPEGGRPVPGTKCCHCECWVETSQENTNRQL